MHLLARTGRHMLAYALGVAAALLSARLVLRLLATRPDNPVVAALYAVTNPPAPLAALDAAQPAFGATLELATLALFLLVLVAGLLAGRLLGARTDRMPKRDA